MSTPTSAVQSLNPNKGVKRPLLGNPTTVPGQLPGFRGRIVDAGGPIKAPKLRNGNVNNETSNVRIPYSRVCPLEFLSSFQGRLGPGDVVFTHKYPPGFVKASAGFNNATLGVNTLSRVLGLDGLNRLLMQSGPNGWRLGENVFAANPGEGALDVFEKDGSFKLSVLGEYNLDGVVISNDEPGAFTSSGSRDNVLFNVAVQGPVETNNGFLKYESEKPDERTYAQYNPLTGAINSRTVEAHARGSSESGMHIENAPMPGRVGNQFAINQGKTDYVANYCGTYSAFPSQMFDRRVEILNTLYLGLRAYELSDEAKMQVTDKMGNRVLPQNTSDKVLKEKRMFFYQYLPFSSRAAAVIQAVTDKHEEMIKTSLEKQGVLPTPEMVTRRLKSGLRPTRAEAAKGVNAVKQQTETQLPSSIFDGATYDPIRSEDIRNMCGAWRLGRVMDTKASVHDRYAGGPRDTAFSCIVDVGVSWRSAFQVNIAAGPLSQPTGFLLPPSEGGYVQMYEKDNEGNDDHSKPIKPPNYAEKSGQQSASCLANNLAPPMFSAIGKDFGRNTLGLSAGVAPGNVEAVMPGGGDEEDGPVVVADRGKSQYQQNLRAQRAQQKRASEEEEKRLALLKGILESKGVRPVASKKQQAAAAVRKLLEKTPKALALLTDNQFGTDPMEKVRKILSTAGANLATVRRSTPDNWSQFTEGKQSLNNLANKGASQQMIKLAREQFDKTKLKWQDAAKAEVNALVEAMKSGDDKPGPIIEAIAQYYEALRSARDAIEKLRDEERDADIKLEYELEMGKFLNRASHFTYIFAKLAGATGAGETIASDFVLQNLEASTDQVLLDSIVLTERILHFSAMCDLHTASIDLYDPRFALPAPTVAPVAATPAATGAKAPVKRGKTPTRPRPAPTGAAAASSSAPVPAAAAGVSSTPLVPTGAPVTAAVDAAPRRRARDTGDSVTNSLFENMFKAAPTDSAVDEPASPTPSSGSEGPTSGPRTFRRQR